MLKNETKGVKITALISATVCIVVLLSCVTQLIQTRSEINALKTLTEEGNVSVHLSALGDVTVSQPHHHPKLGRDIR